MSSNMLTLFAEGVHLTESISHQVGVLAPFVPAWVTNAAPYATYALAARLAWGLLSPLFWVLEQISRAISIAANFAAKAFRNLRDLWRKAGEKAKAFAKFIARALLHAVVRALRSRLND